MLQLCFVTDLGYEGSERLLKVKDISHFCTSLYNFPHVLSLWCMPLNECVLLSAATCLQSFAISSSNCVKLFIGPESLWGNEVKKTYRCVLFVDDGPNARTEGRMECGKSRL